MILQSCAFEVWVVRLRTLPLLSLFCTNLRLPAAPLRLRSKHSLRGMPLHRARQWTCPYKRFKGSLKQPNLAPSPPPWVWCPPLMSQIASSMLWYLLLWQVCGHKPLLEHTEISAPANPTTKTYEIIQVVLPLFRSFCRNLFSHNLTCTHDARINPGWKRHDIRAMLRVQLSARTNKALSNFGLTLGTNFGWSVAFLKPSLQYLPTKEGSSDLSGRDVNVSCNQEQPTVYLAFGHFDRYCLPSILLDW